MRFKQPLQYCRRPNRGGDQGTHTRVHSKGEGALRGWHARTHAHPPPPTHTHTAGPQRTTTPQPESRTQTHNTSTPKVSKSNASRPRQVHRTTRMRCASVGRPHRGQAIEEILQPLFPVSIAPMPDAPNTWTCACGFARQHVRFARAMRAVPRPFFWCKPGSARPGGLTRPPPRAEQASARRRCSCSQARPKQQRTPSTRGQARSAHALRKRRGSVRRGESGSVRAAGASVRACASNPGPEVLCPSARQTETARFSGIARGGECTPGLDNHRPRKKPSGKWARNLSRRETFKPGPG